MKSKNEFAAWVILGTSLFTLGGFGLNYLSHQNKKNEALHEEISKYKIHITEIQNSYDSLLAENKKKIAKGDSLEKVVFSKDKEIAKISSKHNNLYKIHKEKLKEASELRAEYLNQIERNNIIWGMVESYEKKLCPLFPPKDSLNESSISHSQNLKSYIENTTNKK